MHLIVGFHAVVLLSVDLDADFASTGFVTACFDKSVELVDSSFDSRAFWKESFYQFPAGKDNELKSAHPEHPCRT
jgi:hypothetical protein